MKRNNIMIEIELNKIIRAFLISVMGHYDGLLTASGMINESLLRLNALQKPNSKNSLEKQSRKET